jgi:rod shape-determining protein MreC
LAPKFAYFALVGLALGLMIFAKAETAVIEQTRRVVTDAAAPILDVFSRPVASARAVVDEARALAAIRERNAQLARDNARLLHWRDAARRLEAENTVLRDLLRYKPGPEASYISARVIADSGGSFAHSLILNAGARDGVEKGQAVVTGLGLIGRTVDVGQRASRVLLITDLNSRIPVLIERGRVRAILAGDNTGRPRLVHMPSGSAASPGDRVVTSGHAGAFPPGLPVGVVTEVANGTIRVRPFVDHDRLEVVRVVDYGLSGILRDVSGRNPLGGDRAGGTAGAP